MKPAGRTDKLAAELADRFDGYVDAALLRVLLETVPNLQWLDDELCKVSNFR